MSIRRPSLASVAAQTTPMSAPALFQGRVEVSPGVFEDVDIEYPVFLDPVSGDPYKGLQIRQKPGGGKVHLHVLGDSVASPGTPDAEFHLDVDGGYAELEGFAGSHAAGFKLTASDAGVQLEASGGAGAVFRLIAPPTGSPDAAALLVLSSPDGTLYSLTIPNGGGAPIVAAY